MTTAHHTTISPDRPDLAGAFELFVQASKALELQYAQLQEKVERLSADLVSANDRLRVVLDALPAAVLVIENNTISHFNTAAKELFPDLASGLTWKIPSQWQRGSGPDEYLIPGQNSVSQTWQVKRADTNGRSVIQIQDITANLKTLEESERVDRLAAMGQMTAGIAHQIRTPLATALLYAAHLRAPTIANTDRVEFATKLQNRLIHLEKLASEMLQFIRAKPHRNATVSVADLVAEACQSMDGLLQSKRQVLIQQLTAREELALVDRHSVVSALVAILENAIQISPQGATIALQTHLQDQQILISITDQGPGIAADMTDCLFEPFASNRNTGTGLGLAIALNAIRAHRGEIKAHNLPQGGAQFTIVLPSLTTTTEPT